MGINEPFCSRLRRKKRDLKQDYSVISINIRCLLTLDILKTIESIHFSLLWVVLCERTTHKCPGFISAVGEELALAAGWVPSLVGMLHPALLARMKHGHGLSHWFLFFGVVSLGSFIPSIFPRQ